MIEVADTSITGQPSLSHVRRVTAASSARVGSALATVPVSLNTAGSRKSRQRQPDQLVAPLLVINGSINGHECPRRILIDGGATTSFVDRKFTDKHSMATTGLSAPLQVRMANGNMASCRAIVARAQIRVDNYTGVHDLVVMDPVDEFDVILGQSVLQSAGAVVDHRSHTVTWRGDSSDSTTAAGAYGSEGSKELEDRSTSRGTKSRVAATVSATTNVSAQAPERGRMRLQKLIEAYEAAMKPHEGKLPPSRGVDGEFDHKIELREPLKCRPVKRQAIPLKPTAHAEMKKTIDELLKAGLISHSRSPWGASAFFVSKDHGTKLRMVLDYRPLNAVIKRNSASLPHIKELLPHLSKARYFSKLDLRSGYHQVLLRPQDRELTGFVTPMGHFHWNVMPFGEANAPATFVQLINQHVLRDYLYDFVLAFVDDILIFSETEEQHVQHIETVLAKLREEVLFIRPEKCAWMVSEVEFLGYRLRASEHGPTTISTTDDKVDAIRSWPQPATQTQLRKFLGLVNYYSQFIENFAAISAPLSSLTGKQGKIKSAPLEWTEELQRAFEALKEAVCSAPALVVADEQRPFIIHTDASKFAIGAVLSQRDGDGQLRPVSFMSKKLDKSQLSWSTYEKEFFAIVYALEHWEMHLRFSSHKITIHTDHDSLKYISHQQTLKAKQIRWIERLNSFDIELHHIKGEDNAVADALSRRPDHSEELDDDEQSLSDIVKAQFLDRFGGGQRARSAAVKAEDEKQEREVVESGIDVSELLDEIRAGYDDDPECQRMRTEPERYKSTIECGIIKRGPQIVVPNVPALKTKLIREVHDAPTGGHLGIDKTLRRVAMNFRWKGMESDVIEYVNSCVRCAASKSTNQKPAGKLIPIPVTGKGDTITMDFVGPMPLTARNKNMILVMVDKFSKRAWYEAVRSSITAKELAVVFYNTVVRHQGVPRVIISDRGSVFTSELWQSIWKLLGTRLGMSTAFHPQTDGQTERQNRTLVEGLRAFRTNARNDWDLQLCSLEISYNAAMHATTGFSPFRLDIGMEVRLASDLAAQALQPLRCADAVEWLEMIVHDSEVALRNSLAAQRRQKQSADQHRREERYEVGDQVLVAADKLVARKGSTKLWDKFMGPYEVRAVQGDVNVELAMPESYQGHNMFHVERLKRFVPSDEERFPGRLVPPGAVSQEKKIDKGNDQHKEKVDKDGDHQEKVTGPQEEEQKVDDQSVEEDYSPNNPVAEIEREAARSGRRRPNTRSRVEELRQHGGRYDYVDIQTRTDREQERRRRKKLAEREPVVRVSVT